MKLVKCTIIDGHNALKIALENGILLATSRRGNSLCEKIMGININEKIVSVSAILPGYTSYEKYGLIFETDAKPFVVLPFDAVFLRVIERPGIAGGQELKVDIPDQLAEELKQNFVFKTVEEMRKRFSSPGEAADLLIRIVEKHKQSIGSGYYDFILSNFKTYRNAHECRHNEIIFLGNIKIKPLAFFSSDPFYITEYTLKYYKIKSDLPIYNSAEEYFEKNK